MIMLNVFVAVLCIISGIAIGKMLKQEINLGLFCALILFLVSFGFLSIEKSQIEYETINNYKNGKIDVTLEKTEITDNDTIYYYNIIEKQ